MVSKVLPLAFGTSDAALSCLLPQWLAPEAANNFAIVVSIIPAAHLSTPVVRGRFHNKEAAVL